MNIDEWHEQAGRAAYGAFSNGLPLVPWQHIAEDARERWRGVGRAVLAEGKIEVRPSAELAEFATREENKRLAEIATNAVDDVGAAREVVAELRKQVQQYHRAADEHVRKFDRKHEALVAAQQQTDIFRQAALWLASGVGREHIRRCEVEQCDTCSEVLGIEENAQLDDSVRACTGCGKCSYCRKKATDGEA